MRQSKSPLRGSVTQNNVSARARVHEQEDSPLLARLGLLAGFLLAVAAALLWALPPKWTEKTRAALFDSSLSLTRKAQFQVKDIVVEGRRQTSKAEIFDALGTAQGAPILGVDVDRAAEKLGKLPWVDSAVIERRLPDTIAVVLTERVPAARWQREGRIAVIDAEGHILPSAKVENFADLPLVVGAGAEKETQSLFTLLKDFPDIQKKTDSAVRVGERRWDLHLLPKVVVRLPEQDVGNALRRLYVLITQEKILDRDIVAIDLRIPDRLVIEPAGGSQPTGAATP